MKRFLICFLFVTLLIFNGNSQINRPPAEPGKCYAKCVIPDEFSEVEEEVYEYTGDDPSIEGVEFVRIEIAPARKGWEKRKADRNCLSADPEDCMVWCLVDIPEEVIEFYEVIDTSLVKEYALRKLTYKELERAGGFSEWKLIVCEKDVTKRLIKNLQNALINAGFGENIKINGKFSSTTKKALNAFQKQNGLASGGLTYESLDALYVNY